MSPREGAARAGAPAEAPAALGPAAWPFVAVARARSRAGSKTVGADVITWRGPLVSAAHPAGRTITFTTRPRALDAHASFHVPSNARIRYATEHPQFVDVWVSHALTDDERTALQALAQAQDTRPVHVRCGGERVRGAGADRRARPRVGASAAPAGVLDLFRPAAPAQAAPPRAARNLPRTPEDIR